MSESTKPTRSFWIISILALLWNAIGAVTYVMTVTISPEALAAMPEAQRAQLENSPTLVTSAYAIAVWGGTLGCLALLMRKAWAVPVLFVSLIAILVQMGYGVFLTPMLEDQGAAGAVLPVLVVVIAGYLVWFAASARKRGWIG